MTAPRPWIAAHEGYYGPPLEPRARTELIHWLGEHGFDAYVYSPKDDPYQRARWREPYPAAEHQVLAELADTCGSAGIDLGLTISPGLDWRAGDASEVEALVTKVDSLVSLGLGMFGIAWDDVPGRGAAVGGDHGAAVAAVVEALGPQCPRWLTCPVDYALETPTEYLMAFADAVGAGVDIMWTGPSVVPTTLTAEDVSAVSGPLGRPVVFAENFPVNDVGMAPVLHLGPAPRRDADAIDALSGVLVNFMPFPLASRVGLAAVQRGWTQPITDRQEAWSAALAQVPGIGPLARACRSWLDHPGPDPELVEWATAAGPDDQRLRRFLETGCRDGLDVGLATEVAPWLDAWEREAAVMVAALDLLEDDRPPSFLRTAALAEAWHDVRRSQEAVFGIRFAVYPSTRRVPGTHVARPDAVVRGANLTDLVVERALALAG